MKQTTKQTAFSGESFVGALRVNYQTCADLEFFSEGVQLLTSLFFCFFLGGGGGSVDEWIQTPLISGRHRPSSETPF